MAGVCSELATYNWLKTQSGLGELIDTDYQALPLMTMYRAADTLWKHNALIEQTVFSRLTDLFGFSTTITLYDLTNTYFGFQFKPGQNQAPVAQSCIMS
jgi:hypothetical protein